MLQQLERAESEGLRTQLSRDSGLSGPSIFDGQIDFDVCTQLPHDILHVIFEGGLLFHLKYLFSRLQSVLVEEQLLVERVQWIASCSASIGCFGRVSPYFAGQLAKFCDPAENGKCGLRGARCTCVFVFACFALIVEFFISALLTSTVFV